MNIVGYRAITIFVLIEIVGPSRKHVFLSFIFNDIVGPSFIFAPLFSAIYFLMARPAHARSALGFPA